MDQRIVGGSELRVSIACLGTMALAERGMSAEQFFSMLDRAVGAGINFIDTADVYGEDGRAERMLGDWFKRSRRRAEVVLGTKFRFGGQSCRPGTPASRRRILEDCEASLKRLGTDFIDLYQIHLQDSATPEEETLRALDDLVRQGKVRFIGCCNYAAYRMLESLWESKKSGMAGWISMQAQYSLVERSIEREHVPACTRHGLGILPWSPLAGGFLSGKYRPLGGSSPDGRLDGQQLRLRGTDRNWAILEEVERIAGELGARPSQVSLAWLLRKEGVCSVVVGARTPAQLEENIGATSLALSSDQMRRLDSVSAPVLGYPYDMIRRANGLPS